MISESRCDYCKEKTNSLYGLLNMMVCSKCHAELANSFKFAMKN